jgi:hypothetical protein
MYKRTEKYIRQNVSITQQEAVKRILTDKGFQNNERFAALQQRVQNLLSKSKLLVAGSDIDVSSEDAQSRIIRGFHELVSRVYPNLRMLRGFSYSENDISSILKHSQEGLFGNDATALTEAEQEVLAFIQSNNRGGVRTTLKNLMEKFERKPYGWHYAAVLCMAAHLCARGKVEVRVDGNLLDEEDLERALRNSHGHGNVVLEPQVEFTASQVRALKEFYEDLFDHPPHASEAKALGKETGIALQELAHRLAPLAAQAAQYPFLYTLKPVLEKLKECAGKPYTWYLTEFTSQAESLLDMKDDVIDPVFKFMSGPQKCIYDTAREFVRTQDPNFAYIEGDEAEEIIRVLSDPVCFKGNLMQQVKTMLDSLQAKLALQIDSEINAALATVDALKERLCGMGEFGALKSEQQDEITRHFDTLSRKVKDQKLIAVIRDALRRFEDAEYQRLLSQTASWAKSSPGPSHAAETGPNQTTGPGGGSSTLPQEPSIEYVPSRSVRVAFPKAWLADEADVDSYTNAMREALLAEIRSGKRVQV